MNFEVETIRTYEEFEEFNKVIYENFYNVKTKKIAVFVIYILLVAILSLQKKYIEALVIVLIAGIIVFLIKKFVNRDIRNTYDTNKLMQNAKIVYKFSEDKVEVHSPMGIEILEYSKMYKLIETDIYFYMMIAKNMGFIVPKEKMTNEQIEFISALKR